jgi:hypothetical protein
LAEEVKFTLGQFCLSGIAVKLAQQVMSVRESGVKFDAAPGRSE